MPNLSNGLSQDAVAGSDQVKPYEKYDPALEALLDQVGSFNELDKLLSEIEESTGHDFARRDFTLEQSQTIPAQVRLINQLIGRAANQTEFQAVSSLLTQARADIEAAGGISWSQDLKTRPSWYGGLDAGASALADKRPGQQGL
jgi:hypothetical protein